MGGRAGHLVSSAPEQVNAGWTFRQTWCFPRPSAGSGLARSEPPCSHLSTEVLMCFQGRLSCGQGRGRIRATPRLREEDPGDEAGSLWGRGPRVVAEERRELEGGLGRDGQGRGEPRVSVGCEMGSGSRGPALPAAPQSPAHAQSLGSHLYVTRSQSPGHACRAGTQPSPTEGQAKTQLSRN